MSPQPRFLRTVPSCASTTLPRTYQQWIQKCLMYTDGRHGLWWRRIRLDEGLEPLPARIQVSVFHFDRAGGVGQLVEEHPPKKSQPVAACSGVDEVDQLGGVADEIIELLRPCAIANVMPARRDHGHLESLAAQFVPRLRLERVCVGELRQGCCDWRGLCSGC